jgi:hypothetical protein
MIVTIGAGRMLKKSASGVLASLRGSTYRSVRFASLPAAALLDEFFEHPAGTFSVCPRCAGHRSSVGRKVFLAACEPLERGPEDLAVPKRETPNKFLPLNPVYLTIALQQN